MVMLTKEMWERMEPQERRRLENMITLPVVDTTATERVAIGTAGQPGEHAGLAPRFSMTVMAGLGSVFESLGVPPTLLRSDGPAGFCGDQTVPVYYSMVHGRYPKGV